MSQYKIGFCGSGAWGITLADLISRNGHEVIVWSIEEEVLQILEQDHRHPRFSHFAVDERIRYTRNLGDFADVDVIVECVTAKGFRPVCAQLQALGFGDKPFIMTSKGIEQETGLLLVEVAEEVFGHTHHLGCMSGPTLANEVMGRHPTAAVGASETEDIAQIIIELFQSSFFHIDSSSDIRGAALGGAVKNVIAIACGMAEGMGYGYNTKALLITRGLEEMKALARVKGGNEATCNGLAGIGDLIVTGMSNLSRNFSFGLKLGEGDTPVRAKEKIGMVVEGEYTAQSIYHLGKKYGLQLPIAYGVYQVVVEGKDPQTALEVMLKPEIQVTTLPK